MKIHVAFFILSYICVCYCGRDFYNILNVKRGATKNEIKKAYRSLAKLKHPDRNNDPDAENQFRDLNDAYQVLSDEDKREVYDKYGEEGLEKHNQPGMDPFSSFFGDVFFDFGQGRSRSSEMPRGNDVTLDVWVTLEELYVGDFVEIDRIKLVKRETKGVRKCKCRMEMATKMVAPGQFHMHQKEVCDECPNIEFVQEKRMLELEIEVGMRDGQVYPFPGEGEPHIDGEPGDLKFVIRQRKHNKFHRRGDDLYTNVTLSVLESLVGYNLTISHLDDHKLVVTSDKMTSPGSTVRKANEGMPNYENSKVRGSLYITFDVAYPEGKQLSEAERETLRGILQSDQRTLVYNGLDRLTVPHGERVTA